MQGKEFLRSTCMSFFIVVTCVDAAIFILGTLFQKNALFGYEAFLSPLIFGLFSVLPMAVMYSRKELSVKEIIFRKILQLFLLEILLCFITFGDFSTMMEDCTITLSFCTSVMIIFILVHLIIYLLDFRTARQINQQLKEFQSNI